MRNRSALVALLSAVLMAAGGLVGCDEQPGTTSGDPRVEGVLPHALPEADPTILGPQGGVKPRPTAVTTPPKPTPAATGAVVADTGPGATPGTSPTVALPSKTDYSSPKATMKSVTAAMETNDLAAVKACFVAPANDQEKDLLENGFDKDTMDLAALSYALTTKFPAEGPKFGPVGDVFAMIDAAREEINGDKAAIKPPATDPDQTPVNLVKVGNDWKFPIEEGPLLHKKSTTETAESKERREAISSMITDINAGKFASADDASKALSEKMRAINEKYGSPATAPAMPPASAPATAGGVPEAVQTLIKQSITLLEAKKYKDAADLLAGPAMVEQAKKENRYDENVQMITSHSAELLASLKAALNSKPETATANEISFRSAEPGGKSVSFDFIDGSWHLR